MFSIKSYKGEYTVEYIHDLSFHDTKRDIIVVDEYIFNNYLLVKNLEDTFDGSIYTLNASEETKTLEESQKLINYMISIGFNKNNKLIAVGGGVIQDLVSFTASIFKRGVDWYFYPTTLLAQCDSCIGSKTSINHEGYKNLLGGFHPPKHIYIYPEFLSTLPDPEIKNGIGEMLHYFLLNHKFDLAERMVNDPNIRDNIQEYIDESLKIKKEMIEKDEFDQGERNLFNYGHTFGHAIESLSNYEINHGQAVTKGMFIANTISLIKGLINNNMFVRVQDILKKNLPDYHIEDVEKYIEILKKDKKNTNGQLTCILLTEDYGIKTEVSYDEVKSIVERYG